MSSLISSDEVALHLGDPSWIIVDCTFDLADPSVGERLYLEEHLPGAVYAHLDRDLSAPKTGSNGRHPLPDVSTMAATFGRLGIGNTSRVVAYDQDVGMYASRLWWMLRYLGHDAVQVLEGGFTRWCEESRPTRDGRETRPPATFVPHPRAHFLVTADEVEARRAEAGWRLIDARSAERYRGDVEPIDRVAGHIPGAANLPYRDNVEPDGTFLPAEAVRTRFAAFAGAAAPDHVIAYCGSGVSACHLLLALDHAGIEGPKLYAGSWSEWSSDPARPIETTGR